MTDTMTTQNIDLSVWATLYNNNNVLMFFLVHLMKFYELSRLYNIKYDTDYDW
jgi:hypothetical protein